MDSQIVIDARWLHSGIGTYVSGLVRSLGRDRNGLRLKTIVRQQDVGRFAPFCDEVEVVNTTIYTLREQIQIPWAARRCDLLHVPHYNAPLLYAGKLVVTICDLVHISEPSLRWTLKSWLYARPMLHLVARKADHIVALSAHVKAEIVERLGVSPAKVSVIHCGVDSQFRPLEPKDCAETVASELGITRPYILFVGNLKPHKNVPTLLRAFALLRSRRNFDHRLVVVGEDAQGTPELKQEASHLGLDSAVSFLPHVPDRLLPKVYGAADLLVVPSTMEGFGLPVVEAMACGTPVICSRAGSLPEVAGDAAEYFEAPSVEELAESIGRVLASPERQMVMRQKGLERVRHFSWEKCAKQHIEVYRQLLNGSEEKQAKEI
ncbi:MAG: glycosyltransferase family 4 protein [Acidobacteria bacterium]|nr:glycosyltransferase family 4 protein [Acidobacteriota bacterium]